MIEADVTMYKNKRDMEWTKKGVWWLDEKLQQDQPAQEFDISPQVATYHSLVQKLVGAIAPTVIVLIANVYGHRLIFLVVSAASVQGIFRTSKGKGWWGLIFLCRSVESTWLQLWDSIYFFPNPRLARMWHLKWVGIDCSNWSDLCCSIKVLYPHLTLIHY